MELLIITLVKKNILLKYIMPAKKSLCRRVKNQTKCKKLKGCKTAKGPKRTFCRKKKNHTKKHRK